MGLSPLWQQEAATTLMLFVSSTKKKQNINRATLRRRNP